MGSAERKRVVKQNKSVVHIPLKEVLDILEGKSGIVVQPPWCERSTVEEVRLGDLHGENGGQP